MNPVTVLSGGEDIFSRQAARGAVGEIIHVHELADERADSLVLKCEFQTLVEHAASLCVPLSSRMSRAMFGSPVLPEIEKLDAVRDHQRIAFLSCRVDFPWDTTRALEFALFRTFCVPAVSALLDKTQEFGRRAQKRYDDTDIIVSELMEHGYDSERGRAALAQMNAIHGRFKIRNEDFLYVLSTFIFEPIRWNARFGWRRMKDRERLALFHFWRQVGHRMGIQSIPEEYAEFERYNLEYEHGHFRFSETNHRVGVAVREMFKSWFPRWTRSLVERGIYAFMDDNLIRAFGFPRPSPVLRRAVALGLKARAHALRVWPRRQQPLLRTEMKQRSYPQGYQIKSLGPSAPPVGQSDSIGST